MGIPNATKQAAVDAIKGIGAYISAHTSTGAGTTGANEATGGSYVRQLTSWTSNSNGTVSGTAVTVPLAAATYTEGGVYSASTSGTFVGSSAFSGGNLVVSGTGASAVITPSLSVG